MKGRVVGALVRGVTSESDQVGYGELYLGLGILL